MSKASLNNLLELLDVSVEAFAMCEIGDGCGLTVPPMDKIVVHYVLSGAGGIECEHGVFPIFAGDVAVIPKQLAKQINGRGPVTTVTGVESSCPLVPGVVKFRACESGGPGLVLGCASVSADLGEGLGLFDHLRQPMIERAEDATLPLLFDAILGELGRAGIGTKPMVEAMMKQILIVLLRNHLKRVGLHSPLYLPLMNPQLGRALNAMHARPQEAHCVNTLAELAGMSRSRFTHHFSTTYGASPMEYLQSVRLKAGARLLRGSCMPVKSIAAAVGFASRSHFSRAFRARFGADPTAFREADPRNQASEPPRAPDLER